MSFEDLDPYEQQKIKNRIMRENIGKKNNKTEEKPKAKERSVSSFIASLSEGSKIKTHTGEWEVTFIRQDERGEMIITRRKPGLEQSITAEALKREILESRKKMAAQKREKKEADKTTSQEKEKKAKDDTPQERGFGYSPEGNKDFRAGGAERDVGIFGEKIKKEKYSIEDSSLVEETGLPEERLEENLPSDTELGLELEAKRQEEEFSLLNRTQDVIENSNLELSEETIERWRSYFQERHHILLAKIAREFCEKNGLSQKGRENDSAFHIQQLKEQGGIDSLSEEDKERLEKMERMLDVLEIHGRRMTIDERYLLLHFGEERVSELEDTIREKEGRGEDALVEKGELEKVRDMQADILSETLKGEDGEEKFKETIYEKVYDELRMEYEAKGRLGEFERMMAKQRGEKVRLKKGDNEEEFIERREGKYHRVLGEEISNIVGDREKAKGGIEKWYSEIRDRLIGEILDKKEKGELTLGIDKMPETEEEADKAIPGAASKVLGRQVSEEEIQKTKRKMREKGITWEGVKKVFGKAKSPFFILLASVIYIIAGGFAFVGGLFDKAGQFLEKKKKK